MFCELPPVDGRGDDNNGEIDLKSEYKVGTKVLDIFNKRYTQFIFNSSRKCIYAQNNGEIQSTRFGYFV